MPILASPNDVGHETCIIACFDTTSIIQITPKPTDNINTPCTDHTPLHVCRWRQSRYKKYRQRNISPVNNCSKRHANTADHLMCNQRSHSITKHIVSHEISIQKGGDINGQYSGTPNTRGVRRPHKGLVFRNQYCLHTAGIITKPPLLTHHQDRGLTHLKTIRHVNVHGTNIKIHIKNMLCISN